MTEDTYISHRGADWLSSVSPVQQTPARRSQSKFVRLPLNTPDSVALSHSRADGGSNTPAY